MTTLARRRSTLLLLTSATLAAALAGCGDASETRDALRAGHPGGTGTTADAPAATDPAPGAAGGDAGAVDPTAAGGTGGSSGTGGASGALAVPDAGAGGATPPSFFAGAPAYTNTSGRATQVGDHPNGGTASGAACFSCHGNNAFSMVMGGTVYADAAGTTPAANVQVVLKVGATFFSANTNAVGNFVVTGSGFSGTATVGVRSAAATHTMSGGITTGNCNSCHDGTTTSRIHLP